MQKLLELEKKIRELNPELQELTFGCWIKNIHTGLVSISMGEMFEQVAYWNQEMEKVMILGNDCVEIIGHPIHLQHILRALAKTNYYYTIDAFGEIRDSSANSCAIFDLTLHLHLQSDEFISWLYGVLVGE